MNEIGELLHRIDEKTLERLSKPKKELIRFLKEVYSVAEEGSST